MKGSIMEYMIGVFIALALVAVLASIFGGQITQAANAATGCNPMASLISDVSGGSIQPC